MSGLTLRGISGPMRPAPPKSSDKPQTWRERLDALRNIPPLLRMVWDTSPVLSVSTLVLRAIAACFPLATLWVSKLIIDLVVRSIRHQAIHRSDIWKLLIIELLLAVGSDTLGRFISLVDSLLGDQFTNYVSIRLMEHANSLDLVSFEDPVFYDKMERARRQTTSRLGMLAGLAGMGQQLLTYAVPDFGRDFLLALAAAAPAGCDDPGVSGRNEVRDPQLLYAVPVYAGAP